jgi:tetratricopeptide (TPR) repeat protein
MPTEQRIDLVYEAGQLSVEWPDGPTAGQRRPIDLPPLLALLSALHTAEDIRPLATPAQVQQRRAAREALGKALFAALDGPALALRRSLMDRPKRIRLRFCGPKNPALPLRWELLWGPDGPVFTGPRAPDLVLQAGGPAEAPTTRRPHGTLRLLFMAASPQGVQPELDYEGEEERVLQAASPLVTDRRLDLQVVEEGSLGGLREQLVASPFDVLHLTCHGWMSPQGPRLVFEDEQGGRQDVSAAELASVLNESAEPPGLVMVSACHSADPNSALGAFIAALIDAGLPAAVGWSRPVLDTVATEAAAALYLRLAQGKDVAAAVHHAREGLHAAASRPHGDRTADPSEAWATLRLLSEAGGGMAINPVGPRDPQAQSTYTFLAGQVHVLATGFVGRRRELQRLLRLLREGSEGGSPKAGALLLGMKGQGKSCLAARAIARFHTEHQRRNHRVGLVVQHGRLTEGGLLNALIEQAQRWNDRAAEVLLTDAAKPIPARIRTLLTSRWSEERLIILLDDFEQSLHIAPNGEGTLRDEAIAPLDALLGACRVGRPKLLLTSTATFPLPSVRADLSTVAIGGLSPAAARKLWTRNFADATSGVPIDAWTALAQRLGHNPRALDWARRLIKENGDAELAQLAAGIGEALDAAALRRPLIPEEEALVVRLYLQQLAFTQATAEVGADAQEFVRRARVYERAVPTAALAPLADGLNLRLPEDLDRLGNLGLLEHSEAGGARLYRVSPLVMERFDHSEAPRWHAVAARSLGDLVTDLEGVRETWEHALAGGVAEVAEKMGWGLRKALHGLGAYADERKLAERQLDCFPTQVFAWQWAGEAANLMGDVALAGERMKQAIALAPNSGLSDARLSTLLHERATVLHAQGDLNAARACLEQSLAIQRRIYQTDEHPGVATSLHELARVLQAQGDLNAARHYLEQSLAILRRLYQTDEHPDVATSLHKLARVLQDQGDLNAARACLEKSLAIRRRLYQTDEHPGVSASLHALAGVLRAQGDLNAARACLEQSLAIKRRLYQTDEHPDVAASLHELARVLHDQGDLNAAHACLEQSLAIQRRLYQTDEHPKVAASLHALAGVLQVQGDLNAARHCLEQSLAIQRRLYQTDEHPEVSASLHALAGVLQAQGDLNAARACLEQSLAIDRRLYQSDEHPDVSASLHALARVLRAQGDLSAARTCLEQSLAIDRRLYQTDEHPGFAISLLNLAQMEFNDGAQADGIAHMRQSRGILERTCGADQHQTAEAGFVLGWMLLLTGEVREAKPLFVHAARVLHRVNPRHWALPQIAMHLGGRLPL